MTDRSKPMPLKHWSFAGLVLTYWCNARCASCYLNCGPERTGLDMTVEQALDYWQQLIAASPHGCRIHLSGGEPFGDWPRLIEICRRARQQGLAPLQKVETNAFWANDEPLIRDRLRQLDQAGMEKLAISCDPFHQQYVPIENCRRLARLAEESLGAARVQVRWRDWLDNGQDVPPPYGTEIPGILLTHAAAGRDRAGGRFAEQIAPRLLLKSLYELDDTPCRDALLRGRHVHVDASGIVMPGTCAGICLGRIGEGCSVSDLWRRLRDDHEQRAVVGALSGRGPQGLLGQARASGFSPAAGYASKCHLCWELRKHLAARGLHQDELSLL